MRHNRCGWRDVLWPTHYIARMIRTTIRANIIAWGLILGLHSTAGTENARLNGLSMHGSPAHSGLEPLPYVNPDAPKGGKLELTLEGVYDSLNPFNLKAGSTAQGLLGNVYQTLMIRSQDEPFTLYGLIAESLETDEARSFITFHLNPKAHFSDGHPLTTEDVQFTFDLLKSKGRPPQRTAYSQVKAVTLLSDHDIKFDLGNNEDRELPLSLGLMPVLPKHATDVVKFTEANLGIPVASGPYKIESLIPGTELTFRRDPNYWGNDLPISRGMYNFDVLHLTYIRDANAVFESFKAGLSDFRSESDATRWLSGYDFPAVHDGRVILKVQKFGLPKGMDGFAFNTRRPIFSDARVREALGYVFDFEWVNTKLFSGLFKRSASFFDDSVLSSHEQPASQGELALLKPFPKAVRSDILAGSWSPPHSNGSGYDRDAAQSALKLLSEAGYHLQDGQLMTPNGEPLTFEIMVESRQKERLALVYAENLRRIGVSMRVHYVDEVQYQRRRQKFDFDMMIGSWTATPSPGNEQRGRWSSNAARQEGSFNLTGAASPAIDALIEDIVNARNDDDFIDAVRAYDRVLLSGFYIVPLYYKSDQWFAYSSRIAKPDYVPMFGISPDPLQSLATWWSTKP